MSQRMNWWSRKDHRERFITCWGEAESSSLWWKKRVWRGGGRTYIETTPLNNEASNANTNIANTKWRKPSWAAMGVRRWLMKSIMNETTTEREILKSSLNGIASLIHSMGYEMIILCLIRIVGLGYWRCSLQTAHIWLVGKWEHSRRTRVIREYSWHLISEVEFRLLLLLLFCYIAVVQGQRVRHGYDVCWPFSNVALRPRLHFTVTPLFVFDGLYVFMHDCYSVLIIRILI